jgi:hypothetical protein
MLLLAMQERRVQVSDLTCDWVCGAECTSVQAVGKEKVQ